MSLNRNCIWPRGCGEQFSQREEHIRASESGTEYQGGTREDQDSPYTWSCGEPISPEIARYHLKCAQKNGVVW